MTSPKTHLAPTRAGQRPRGGIAPLLARLLAAVYPDATPQQPVLVAIGGPGGTGKSTLAAALGRELQVPVLPLDHYKTPRAERAARGIYGAHPEANRIGLVREHLAALKRGDAIAHPVYDNATGEATSVKTFQAGRFVLLDGEISTYDALRDLADFSIFIDSDWKTQLETRISRDIEERGYTREKAIATFLQSNLREFAEFGAASKVHADIHLYAHHDRRIDIESVETTLFERNRAMFEPELTPVDLDGLIVPLIVPYEDNGALCERALIEHLEFLAEHGVHRLLVNGTTGDFFSLSQAERRRVLMVSRFYFPGLLIYHVGHTSLGEAVADVRFGEDEGADAVMSLPPFYPAGEPTGVISRWLGALAATAQAPFLIYNFPKHTGNPVTPDVLAAVRHHGLKDSSGDLGLVRSTPRYYAGTERMIFAAWQSGSVGFVCARANAEPVPFVRMEFLQRGGEVEQAAHLQDEISELAMRMTGPDLTSIIKRRLAEHHLTGYPTRAWHERH